MSSTLTAPLRTTFSVALPLTDFPLATDRNLSTSFVVEFDAWLHDDDVRWAIRDVRSLVTRFGTFGDRVDVFADKPEAKASALAWVATELTTLDKQHWREIVERRARVVLRELV